MHEAASGLIPNSSRFPEHHIAQTLDVAPFAKIKQDKSSLKILHVVGHLKSTQSQQFLELKIISIELSLQEKRRTEKNSWETSGEKWVLWGWVWLE